MEPPIVNLAISRAIRPIQTAVGVGSGAAGDGVELVPDAARGRPGPMVMGESDDLATVFEACRHESGPFELDAMRTDDLRRALALAWREGSAAWPGVDVEAASFTRHLAARVPAGRDVVPFLATLHLTDLYLACGCTRGSPAALAALDRLFLAQVSAFVARIDPTPAFADEVRQVMREKLLVAVAGEPRIAEYAGTGALASWLRAVAVRTALNLRRNQDDRPHEHFDDSAMETVLGAESPELAYVRAHRQAEFKEAFRAALDALGREERAVLRLHLGGGLTGEQIAACLHVHRATVVRRLASAHETLKTETQRRLRERLRLNSAELESLIAVVRSRLDLSLQRILAHEG